MDGERAVAIPAGASASLGSAIPSRLRPVPGGGGGWDWPLPWPILAGLAALLGMTAFLPPPLGQLVALVAVICLGVPHGALDGEVARPLLRPRFGRAWFIIFALPYLALSAAVLLAWRAVPDVTLAAFLAASVLHFGDEDAGPDHPLEAIVRGGLPIALPVLLHPEAVARIFGTVILAPMPAIPAWWHLGAVAWAVLLPFSLMVMSSERRWLAIAEMVVLVALFAALPPLAAFALYFVALHAPRHMAALAADPHRAPRVRSLGEAARRSVPVTGLTLLLGAALWPLFPGAAPDRLLAITLQGLAALTLPHLLLEWMASASGRPACRPSRSGAGQQGGAAFGPGQVYEAMVPPTRRLKRKAGSVKPSILRKA